MQLIKLANCTNNIIKMNQNWDQQIVLWPNDDQCLQLYQTKLPQLWLCYTKGNRPSLQMSYDEGAWKPIHRCHVWYQCYRTFITSALFMKSRRKSHKLRSSFQPATSMASVINLIHSNSFQFIYQIYLSDIFNICSLFFHLEIVHNPIKSSRIQSPYRSTI